MVEGILILMGVLFLYLKDHTKKYYRYYIRNTQFGNDVLSLRYKMERLPKGPMATWCKPPCKNRKFCI